MAGLWSGITDVQRRASSRAACIPCRAVWEMLGSSICDAPSVMLIRRRTHLTMSTRRRTHLTMSTHPPDDVDGVVGRRLLRRLPGDQLQEDDPQAVHVHEVRRILGAALLWFQKQEAKQHQ